MLHNDGIHSASSRVGETARIKIGGAYSTLGKTRYAYKMSIENLDEKRTFWELESPCEDNIKVDVK